MAQPILLRRSRRRKAPVLLHDRDSSQIYTDGPATSRPTSSAVRPQNEQRSLDRLHTHRAMAVSVRPIFLYLRFAPAQNPERSSPCRAVSSFRAQGGHSQVVRPVALTGSRLPGGVLCVLLILEEFLARDLFLG